MYFVGIFSYGFISIQISANGYISLGEYEDSWFEELPQITGHSLAPFLAIANNGTIYYRYVMQ